MTLFQASSSVYWINKFLLKKNTTCKLRTGHTTSLVFKEKKMGEEKTKKYPNYISCYILSIKKDMRINDSNDTIVTISEIEKMERKEFLFECFDKKQHQVIKQLK